MRMEVQKRAIASGAALCAIAPRQALCAIALHMLAPFVLDLIKIFINSIFTKKSIKSYLMKRKNRWKKMRLASQNSTCYFLKTTGFSCIET